MIDVILVSHGSLANGLRDATEIIIGEQEHLKVLGLYPGDTLATFTEKLNRIIDTCEDPEQIMILADLRNGTPFNAALMVSLQKGCVCISGMNLPLLLGVLSSRDELDIKGLSALALKLGCDGIVCSDDLKKKLEKGEKH
ncbi:MAG: PTS sugar transporter subunit IIA [Anaerolineaceae bacterium]|nr:PTS sugar transporter subunit IIA [Anaerolineaceae bacterium]